MRTCMPPMPNPSEPAYTPPPGACDAHCHVFGPADRFPYHPTASYHPPDAPAERLAALHDHLGIDRGVIVQASCHGPDNRAMLDAIARAGGRYRGVCIADGSFTRRDFEGLHDGGVRGVRFNFVAHLGGAPDLDLVRRTVATVAPLGWHLVVHVGADDLVRYQDVLLELDLPVVVDHMGRVPTEGGIEQEAFQILLRALERPSWWAKICGAERISADGPPFHDAVPFAQALIETAPDRILWGTDWPHPNIKKHMPDDGGLVDLIPLFAPDPEAQRRILVDNPARLYGFDD